MKHIKQLKFTKNNRRELWTGHHGLHQVTQPMLCASTMKHYFYMPAKGSVYATVSTKRPAKKRFSAECLEFRYDENGHFEIRRSRKSTKWEFTPTLHELDEFLLVECGINREQSYFVYFEEDA
jgi:hypothetical protein